LDAIEREPIRGAAPTPDYMESLYARITSGHIAHALLFLGPAGSGKQALAGRVAAALLCESGGVPCGQCRGCRLYNSGNHPELIRIEPENGLIKIARIRQMQQQIYIKPVQARRWVVLLDQADRMNHQAQNALLKTLEEPPQATLILTAASLARLLPTIRSRCQIYRVPPLSPARTAALLAQRTGIDAERALLYARMGNSAGAALELAQWPEYAEMRGQVLGLCVDAANGDMEKVLLAEPVISKYRDNMDKVLDILLSWTRDLRIYGATQRLDWIINKEYADTINALTERISEQMIHRQERALRRTLRMIEQNAHTVLAVQQYLLTVAKGDTDGDHRRDQI
jgi:DNA polymerase-3 subunit delta'